MKMSRVGQLKKRAANLYYDTRTGRISVAKSKKHGRLLSALCLEFSVSNDCIVWAELAGEAEMLARLCMLGHVAPVLLNSGELEAGTRKRR